MLYKRAADIVMTDAAIFGVVGAVIWLYIERRINCGGRFRYWWRNWLLPWFTKDVSSLNSKHRQRCVKLKSKKIHGVPPNWVLNPDVTYKICASPVNSRSGPRGQTAAGGVI